jgi:hypothetical protein
VSDIYLHIGLHKTGTKFYQHKFFNFLDKNNINYNDHQLKQYLFDYIKLSERQYNSEAKRDLKFNINKLIINRINKINKKILISAEIMSQDCFHGYPKWDESIKTLKEIFPSAKIIVSFRYQLDWLLSCYRETIHMHHYQSFMDFIDVHSENKYAKINPYELDWRKNIEGIYKFFEPKNVKILFYEDFKENSKKHIEEILEYIKHPKFEVNNKTIPNKGYSALAINLSIIKSKIFPYFTHRPVFFFGENGVPAGTEEYSALPKEPFWGEYFLRDNEEIREVGYPNISWLSRLKRYFTWRYFIKEVFDKLIYIDWDIIKHKKSELDDHYKKINKGLLNYIDNIPDKYIK